MVAGCETFSTGGSPTAIAATAGDLWVAEGRGGGPSQYLGARTRSVAHLAGPLRAMRDRISLPTGGGRVSTSRNDRIALSRRAVWVIAGDGSLVQIDPLSDEVVRVLPLHAIAVAAAEDRAWALTSDRSLVPVGERVGTGDAPIDASPGASALAVGGNALWVSDAGAGELLRIDPADPAARRKIAVGAGAGEVAYGDGAAWVLDPARGRALRVDGESGSVTGAVAVGGTPREWPSPATTYGYPSVRVRAPRPRPAARCRAAARPPTSSSSPTFPCAADGAPPRSRWLRRSAKSSGSAATAPATTASATGSATTRPRKRPRSTREVRGQRADLRRRPARRDRSRAVPAAAPDPDRGRGAERPARDGVADKHRPAAHARCEAERATRVYAAHGSRGPVGGGDGR